MVNNRTKLKLENYIRKIVKEEFSDRKNTISEVQSRYFISYYARVGEHGEAGTYPDFNSAYRAAVAKSRNEDFMDGLDYLGVEGSGTNANQFAIIYINDFYVNNRLGSSDFDNKDAANKFRTVAKKVLATGRPVRSTYSN